MTVQLLIGYSDCNLDTKALIFTAHATVSTTDADMHEAAYSAYTSAYVRSPRSTVHACATLRAIIRVIDLVARGVSLKHSAAAVETFVRYTK